VCLTVNNLILLLINTVVDYCAVEVYLHAFSTTAVDGDVPLTSNSEGWFPAEKTTGTQCIRGMVWQTEGAGWIKGSSLAHLQEPETPSSRP
jgi:hypothetical protein